jgi:hypothetical protein
VWSRSRWGIRAGVYAAGICIVLASVGLLLHLTAGWDLPKLVVLVLAAVTLIGIDLALTAQKAEKSAPKDEESPDKDEKLREKSIWVEVGRGLFISGVLAVAVWGTDQVRRDFEHHQAQVQHDFDQQQSLRLTIGVRQKPVGDRPPRARPFRV